MLFWDCTLHHTVKLLMPAEHPSPKVVLTIGKLTCFLIGRGHRRALGRSVLCHPASLSMALSLRSTLYSHDGAQVPGCLSSPSPWSHKSACLPREPDVSEKYSHSLPSFTPPQEKPFVDCLSRAVVFPRRV